MQYLVLVYNNFNEENRLCQLPVTTYCFPLCEDLTNWFRLNPHPSFSKFLDTNAMYFK